MTKKTALRFYLEKDDIKYKLMWVRPLNSDRSIMCGFSHTEIEKVYYPNLLTDPSYVPIVKENKKFSIHKSGLIKPSHIGNRSNLRLTVKNKLFNDVDSPNRIAEIILPLEISFFTRESPNPKKSGNIVIDFNSNSFNRLAIFNMSKKWFENNTENLEKNILFTEDSIFEESYYYEYKDIVWAFIFKESDFKNNPTKGILCKWYGEI